MGRLVDTDIFVALERRGLPIASLTAVVGAEDEPVALASITAAELLTGVERAGPERRAARSEFVEGILSAFTVLPFDLSVARVHARVWAEQRRLGQPIGQHDTIIAATAMTHNYSLVTGNVAEFSRIRGLHVETASWNAP